MNEFQAVIKRSGKGISKIKGIGEFTILGGGYAVLANKVKKILSFNLDGSKCHEDDR